MVAIVSFFYPGQRQKLCLTLETIDEKDRFVTLLLLREVSVGKKTLLIDYGTNRKLGIPLQR